MQVGFIGSGIIDPRMATKVQEASYELVVRDIRQSLGYEARPGLDPPKGAW